MIVPVSASYHNIIAVVKNTWYSGDDLGYLCVKEILAIYSTERKSLIAVVPPWCREGHDFSGFFIQGKLVVAMIEISFAEDCAIFEFVHRIFGNRCLYLLGA